MVARAPNHLLGAGLYTLDEAALYARLRRQTLARWFYGNKRGQAVLDKQFHVEEKVISFLDFVQAMAVRSVRLDRKVPLSKIRKAVRLAETEYGVKYPFARKHTTYLVGSEIVIKLNEDEYVEVSGSHARNRVFTKIVEFYMIDLAFDAEGFAYRYDAFKWENRIISMNPRLRFGEPIIPTCGYSAQALYDAYKSEGTVGRAAKAYGVEPPDIEVAVRYIDHLTSNLAA